MTDHIIGSGQLDDLQKELQHSYTAEFVEDAEDLLIEAKENLVDVNNWTKISGLSNSIFQLTDNHKKEVNRSAHTGDYIKLEKDNNTYWFHVDIVEYDDYPDENKESFTISLNPLDTINNKLINLSIERINLKLFARLYITTGIADKNAATSDNNLPVLVEKEWDQLIQGFIRF